MINLVGANTGTFKSVTIGVIGVFGLRDYVFFSYSLIWIGIYLEAINLLL